MHLQKEQMQLFAKKFPEKSLETIIREFSTKSEFVSTPMPLATVKELADDYFYIVKLGERLHGKSIETLAYEACEKGKWIREHPSGYGGQVAN